MVNLHSELLNYQRVQYTIGFAGADFYRWEITHVYGHLNGKTISRKTIMCY
jgi:hypothetical protein